MAPSPSAPPSVVVINLDRDAERLAYMRAQLERLQVHFQRFPAISGASAPAEFRSYFGDAARRFLSPGEIGCYASHLAVYSALREGRIPAPALVLEDDVETPGDLPEVLEALLAALPEGWDMVRLSSPAKRAYVHVTDLPGGRALVRSAVSPGSNGALLVSRSGARKFLDGVERRLPIDQDNRLPWRFNMNLYGVVPALIVGNALQTSTIDDLAGGQSREDAARQRVLRRERQMWRRHGWNIKQFGVTGWAAAEAASFAAALMARRNRAAFLQRMSHVLQRISRPPR